jgi:formylglycine-generating enzyme
VGEAGWDSAWSSNLATTSAGWTTNLSCDPTYQTWTDAAAANEERPIVCDTWFEAAAFCIWDGGFLPSETEWSYAAAGGNEQRSYPWAKAYPDSTIGADCTNANYSGCSGTTQKVGTALGDGKWGQADLGGNAWEWNADWYRAIYPLPCTDCASLVPASYRVIRGGSFLDGTLYLLASARYSIPPAGRNKVVGFRCARTP